MHVEHCCYWRTRKHYQDGCQHRLPRSRVTDALDTIPRSACQRYQEGKVSDTYSNAYIENNANGTYTPGDRWAWYSVVEDGQVPGQDALTPSHDLTGHQRSYFDTRISWVANGRVFHEEGRENKQLWDLYIVLSMPYNQLGFVAIWDENVQDTIANTDVDQGRCWSDRIASKMLALHQCQRQIIFTFAAFFDVADHESCTSGITGLKGKMLTEKSSELHRRANIKGRVLE